MEEIYKDIDIKILFKQNRLKCGVLKEDWYVKNNLNELLSNIHNVTSFLNDYEPSLRERIYYIEKNITETQTCSFCKRNKLKFLSNKIRFSLSCSDIECKRKLKCITTKNMHLNMDENTKLNRNEKLRKFNLGKVLSEEHKEKLSKVNLGKKQSESTKLKRVKTRRDNNDVWHKDSTKNKISKTNKLTHNSEEFKEKRKLIYNDDYRKNLSCIMKNKILNGEFTPCITNSWTNWSSFVELNGETKKFRSNWEAVFWLLNKNLEYEKTRIPYKFKNENKIYILDFTDVKNRILYEIKPNSELYTEKVKSKFKYCSKWCNENEWEFKIISDEWFEVNAGKIDYFQHPQLKKSMKKFI
jgi:ribosomal protein L37AE/L43A